MAQQNANNDLAARVQEAQELLVDIQSQKQWSNKDLIAFRQRKDGIVGTGQHHTGRSATKNQIVGDLQTFIGKFGQ